MRKYLKMNLLFIMITFLLYGCLGIEKERVSKQTSVNNAVVSDLENLLEKYSKEFDFGGTVLIAEDGETLIEKGYGMAEYDNTIQNDPNTIFRLGSITKQFTSMCILMLEERGGVKTTDTLDKYIPGYPNGDRITIYNLLTQTSGLPEYTTADTIAGANHYFSPEDIISLVKDKPLVFEPNSRFQYCNTNYILLGYIIEKASGQKYEKFLKNNIFIPLGMENTYYDHNDSSSNKAVGYVCTGGNPKKAGYIDMSFAYSAGALQSTVGDLYKWDQALYTEKLVKRNSLNKMLARNKDNYACGWFIVNSDIMLHGGNINGFSTIIYRDTKLKRVIIILANRDQYKVEQLANEIVSILDSKQ